MTGLVWPGLRGVAGLGRLGWRGVALRGWACGAGLARLGWRGWAGAAGLARPSWRGWAGLAWPGGGAVV